MTRDLQRALERVRVPGGEDAGARAWPAVAGAFAAREPPRRRRSRPGAAVLVAAAVACAAAALVLALTPPGAAVAQWVGGVLALRPPTTPAPRPRASLGPLPAGHLLVTAGGRAFVVDARGHRTSLGRWSGASWSPHGRFVIVWRGHDLAALTPSARVAWRFRARGIVRDARWSPDGFHVAFRADDRLAVVAGDGTAGRVLARHVRPIAPAWRPRAPHELAWVRRDGRVTVRDVDTGAPVYRSPARLPAPAGLSWSSDGRRLLLRRPGALRVAHPATGRVERLPTGPGVRVDAAAYAPRGSRLAVLLVRPGGVREVRVGARRIFVTTGDLRGLQWSPDGRRLLMRRRGADQWLLLPADPGGRARVVAVAAVSRRFGGAPLVQGWRRRR